MKIPQGLVTAGVLKQQGLLWMGHVNAGLRSAIARVNDCAVLNHSLVFLKNYDFLLI